MGQHYRHEDIETTEAGGMIYDAICRCKDQGIAHHKIMLALVAELHGLSDDYSYHLTVKKDD